MVNDGIPKGNCFEVEQNHLCQLEEGDTLLAISVTGNTLVIDVFIIFLGFSARLEGTNIIHMQLEDIVHHTYTF